MIVDFSHTNWQLIKRVYADAEIRKQVEHSHAINEARRWAAKEGWNTRLTNKKIKP